MSEQCHGTARYSRRCRRLAPEGFTTCGLHRDQERIAAHWKAWRGSVKR